MKDNKQNIDFLIIGIKIIRWYKLNGRKLPWRNTKNPYFIWISEIILQQTQVRQGWEHYLRFTERFPDIKTLAKAHTDEVLLYWKGLGYYSRAINLHKAAQQIMNNFGGIFPSSYKEILALKGVGKYTAAAVSSICFNEKKPAVDGNFYRVFSRVFADDFDISNSKAFEYFSNLALMTMPQNNCGDFNQGIMDIGSEICKPKNPSCEVCPIAEHCLAFSTGTSLSFPVKTKKIKIQNLSLTYFFIFYDNQFLVQQRDKTSIWKKLFEFPTKIDQELLSYQTNEQRIKHKLTHKNLEITIKIIKPNKAEIFLKAAKNYIIMDTAKAHLHSFPKPLQNFYEQFFK
ncbi:A/G-specific adenine glycosylase [Riemerella columbipharyngis]|uniref:Adenine DNA glycosylase n=1 Tax=Riemerella columbipharyngis TaxID=1071918 RepID=A0A1G6Y574_9FLAO|nr:A/G-specific adenine glycosylase [Riemerella columbipharyngis]SDD85123.1 A/G-specific adenine glycosylase [Riemerella columbipharyngis]